jgi:hypothetical protein
MDPSVAPQRNVWNPHDAAVSSTVFVSSKCADDLQILIQM